MPKLDKTPEHITTVKSGISMTSGTTLYFRGYAISDLAKNASYEEVIHLLLSGQLPTTRQLDILCAALTQARRIPVPLLQVLRNLPHSASAMDQLRTAVSLHAHYEQLATDSSDQARTIQALQLIGIMPALVAAIGRLSQGNTISNSTAGKGTAEAFLRMLHGHMPDVDTAKDLDLWMILHAEHTLNASTFAARVCASTLADMHSAVVAAISTLKGTLHGGANLAVLDMLKTIRVPERADAYVREQLAKGHRIMGFGHRVYKQADPRVAFLKEKSQELGRMHKDMSWHEIAVEVENAVWIHRQLHPNIDFYSATVLHYLGIPQQLFPPMFAMARITGWIAHIFEQQGDNRLIRPHQHYIGSAPRLWLPLERR